MKKDLKIIIIFLFFMYIPLFPEEYVIRYLGELEELRVSIQNGNTYLGDTIVIAEDLDFENRYFPGLGDDENIFEGTIEGRGKTFFNYNSDYPFVYILGKNGSIKNILIDNGKIEGDNSAAFVYLNKGTISSCLNGAYVYGKKNAAGICVFNEGIITSCYNTQDIKSEADNLDPNIGGIVAFNDGGYVELSVNAGDLYGYCTVGGIAGYSENGSINKCYNAGKIDGGVAAGIVGMAKKTKIMNTYNIGNISLTIDDSGAGGIFGSAVNSDVSYSFNLGEIKHTVNSYAGSIGAYMENTTFDECLHLSGTVGVGNEYVNPGDYSLGNIIGNAMLKGLSGVKAISKKKFSNPDTFSKWGIGSIWEFNGKWYPSLVDVVN